MGVFEVAIPIFGNGPLISPNISTMISTIIYVIINLFEKMENLRLFPPPTDGVPTGNGAISGSGDWGLAPITTWTTVCRRRCQTRVIYLTI